MIAFALAIFADLPMTPECVTGSGLARGNYRCCICWVSGWETRGSGASGGVDGADVVPPLPPPAESDTPGEQDRRW